MAATICQCPTPPGGQARCGENQLAICRVINGVAHTECITVPSDLTSLTSTQGKNWLLSIVLNTFRLSSQPISADEEEILDRGSYTVPGTDDVVRFAAPVTDERSTPIPAQ
jgi:hypothetical protein